jgi:hypothetical protein
LTRSSAVNGEAIFTFMTFVAISVPLSIKLSLRGWQHLHKQCYQDGWTP